MKCSSVVNLIPSVYMTHFVSHARIVANCHFFRPQAAKAWRSLTSASSSGYVTMIRAGLTQPGPKEPLVDMCLSAEYSRNLHIYIYS
jgi:hypothetical protein